jgi:hypothetical protein
VFDKPQFVNIEANEGTVSNSLKNQALNAEEGLGSIKVDFYTALMTDGIRGPSSKFGKLKNACPQKATVKEFDGKKPWQQPSVTAVAGRSWTEPPSLPAGTPTKIWTYTSNSPITSITVPYHTKLILDLLEKQCKKYMSNVKTEVEEQSKTKKSSAPVIPVYDLILNDSDDGDAADANQKNKRVLPVWDADSFQFSPSKRPSSTLGGGDGNGGGSSSSCQAASSSSSSSGTDRQALAVQAGPTAESGVSASVPAATYTRAEEILHTV